MRLVRDTGADIKVKRGEGKAHADQQSLVRVDVFWKDGLCYRLPIYAWQVATLDWPPNRVIKNGAEERD